MDFHAYTKAVGGKRAKDVVEAAGSDWGYFQHIIHYRKRPSVDLATRIEAESRKSAKKNKDEFIVTVPELLLTNAELAKRHKKLKGE